MSLAQFYGYFLDFISFILVLGIAIVIHEAGHMIVARLSGVRVEKFSVGFGKALFSFKRGDTEYILAPIPLGGYVKMAGENPAELTGAKDEFYSLSPLRRIPTVLAGPGANVIGAFAIFFALAFMFGEEYRENVVGSVIPGSLAEKHGLEPQDRILAVNGQPIESWEEFQTLLAEAQGREDATLELKISRQAEELQVNLPISEEILDQSLVVAMVEPVGPAFKLGLERGDRILSIDHREPANWTELRDITKDLWDPTPRGPEARTVSLRWQTVTGEVKSASITPALVKDGEGEMVAMMAVAQSRLGLTARMAPVVGSTIRGFPAADMDIQPGATILAVNGEPVQDALDIERSIAFSYREIGPATDVEIEPIPFTVTWINPDDTDPQTEEVTPRIEWTPDPESRISVQHGKQFAVAQLGVSFKQPHREIGFLGSLRSAGEQTAGAVAETWFVLKGLVTREVSHKLIGGPVAIAQISARVGRDGYRRLFWLCAVLQVNLALLNLLPIPILDGGHIAVSLCEGVARRRFSLRTREVIQYIGLAILLPLFGFVIINDFARFEWVQNLVGQIKELIS